MTTPVHEIVDFMRDATNRLQREYQRIHRRAGEDPGSAGDVGEENWARLLRRWLPPSYQIVTKGRIVGEDGNAGPQVDVLVLSPHYPKVLRSSKVYLAGGVLAAFECKLALEGRHIEKAMQTSVAIRGLTPAQTGTPFRELYSPLIFGVLAHVHCWKDGPTDPGRHVCAALQRSDEKFIKHPREMLDLVCVSNLGTWVSHRIAWVAPYMVPGSKEVEDLLGGEGRAVTAYVGGTTRGDPGRPGVVQRETYTPVGKALCHLLRRLAWRDASLRDLAEHFSAIGIEGEGSGVQRRWCGEIYSPAVRAAVTAGRWPAESLQRWSEWRLSM